MFLKNYINAIDTSYTESIVDKLSSFGDDPVTGNRAAGSPACTKAANYLYNKFKEIGLKNVTLDSYLVNGWIFGGASLEYTDDKCKPQKITLGGYATNFKANHEKYMLVFGGKGTLQELEALGDITGKLVLISPLNTSTDYYVCFPAYQAYLKNAAGIIVAAVHEEEIEEALISNDVSTPCYCKTLAISPGAAKQLQALLDASRSKELPVILNADSTVNPYERSYNVWGEIPGKSDEVLYLIAHYDGYYHSCFDDASGVSEILGIAKALIDSGYQNNRTIRVIAHGAEEWGNGYNGFDWAAGAYQQIFRLRPQWVKKAFALINIDGNFPVDKERSFVIYTSPELCNYVKSVTPDILLEYPGYKFEIQQPVPLFYEDFSYQRAGIPAITAGDDFENSIYYRRYLHSSLDNKLTGFDMKTHKLIQVLYGSILMNLDTLPLRPMDFNIRFDELKNSINSQLVGKEFMELAGQLCYYSKLLTRQIYKVNHMEKACDSKLQDKINRNLYRIFKTIQDEFLALDYTPESIFPHSLPQKNMELLSKAMEALQNHSETIEAVLHKYILPIDMNYCVFDYDKQTYDFFAYQYSYGNNQTFGEKMYLYPPQDLYDLAHMLQAKAGEPSPCLTKELRILSEAYGNQKLYLKKAVEKETKAGKILVSLMKSLIDLTIV